MSSLHRVEGLRVLGDGSAPGMARRGPWHSAGRGIGCPWRSGATWILSRRRGGAVGGIRSEMGTFGRAVPLGARGAAGLEDEGAGRRLRGEEYALVQDDEAAIEELTQLDATAGVGAMVRAGGQLDPAGPEVDGVVAGHLARVAAAEDEGELARGGPPSRRRVARGAREAGVQVREERGQKGIGSLGGGDVAEAQFAAQAILQGAPEAFDAAFGFGRASLEVADAEVVQDAAEVGGVLSAPQLFGEAPVRVITDEEVDAIAVDGEGPPILGEHLLEDGGIAVQVLGGAEVQGEDRTGGIIDGAVQGHGGAPGLKPGKGAGVDLDQLPHPGLGRPAVSVLPRPAAVLRRQAQGAAPPADQFAADAQALHLAQLLGSVAVIEVKSL